MRIDVAIIGAGPAGLSAGIFTCRAGLKTICFEKLAVGGQAALSYDIANYPGFESISGFELTDKFLKQAQSCGLGLEYGNVTSLTQHDKGFELVVSDKTYFANKVIVACGCKARKLQIKNEDKLLGRGISYCASCDGGFFRKKNVAVVGGGDTAFENVEYLSRIANKVILLNRSEKFRGQAVTLENIKKLDNVEILTNSQVVQINGDETLESIDIMHNEKKENLKIDGLFIAIGYEPDISFIKCDITKDDYGYIRVNENQETNIKDLYACGDIVSKNFKQVITACADGARAGNSCIGR